MPVYAATQEPGTASASRYLRGFFAMPSPTAQPEAFREGLCELGRRFAEPPVLIPCDDVTVEVVARGATALAEVFRLVGPSPEVALVTLDKRTQSQRVRELGIAMPRTWSPKTPEDAERIAAEARFPLVVKPASAQQFLVTYGFKATTVASPLELVAMLDRFDDMVVQELIPGEIETLYEHNSFVTRDGRVLVSTVARKRDEDPKPFGSATAIEMVHLPAVEELGLRVVQAFGFRGGSHTEFKWDEEAGEYKFIEFNPRFAWSAMVQLAAGVDTIYPQYAEAVGLPFDPVPARLQRTVWSVPERITKGKAIRPPRPLPGSIPGPTRYVTDLFDPRDPWDLGPLAAELRQGLVRRLTKLSRGLPARLRGEALARAELTRTPRVARVLETLGRPRETAAVPVTLYTGQTPEGGPLTVAAAAPEDAIAPLLHRWFSGTPTAEPRGRVEVRQPPADPPAADLVVILPPPARWRGYHDADWLLIPVRTHRSATLDLPTGEILRQMDPALHAELAAAAAGHFAHERVDGARGWAEFYEKMYQPTVGGGWLRDTPGLARLQRLARDGQCHFAVLDGSRLAGVVTLPGRGGEVRLLAAGVLYGSRRMREAGAFAAAHAAAVDWARQEGHQRIAWEALPTTPAAGLPPDGAGRLLAILARTDAGQRALESLAGAEPGSG